MQTLYSLSPQCSMSRFNNIGHLVLETNMFKSFFPHLWACRPPWSSDLNLFTNFPSPFQRDSLHENLALVGQVVSEKKISKIVHRRS